jgi:phosphatidate cytidylyltransferase
MSVQSTFPLYTAIAGNFTLLMAATGIVQLFQSHWNRASYIELSRRIRTWWLIYGALSAALIFSQSAFLTLMAIVSFIALREFVSIITTSARYRGTVLMLYALIPVHYCLIGLGLPDWAVLVTPLISIMLLQISMMMRGHTDDYLPVASQLLWGFMICVFCIGFVAQLRMLPGETSGAELVIFVILLTEFNDVAQYVWGKTIGGRKIAARISPNKTWAGFVGGTVSTVTVASALGPFLGLFSFTSALFAGLVIAVAGFFGDLNISALKRHLNIKNSSQLLPGHGGLLDRVDSLSFSAPAMFIYCLCLS